MRGLSNRQNCDPCSCLMLTFPSNTHLRICHSSNFFFSHRQRRSGNPLHVSSPVCLSVNALYFAVRKIFLWVTLRVSASVGIVCVSVSISCTFYMSLFVYAHTVCTVCNCNIFSYCSSTSICFYATNNASSFLHFGTFWPS